MDTNPQALTLGFGTEPRVPGETLHGHVDINLALAQKDGIRKVQVSLYGYIHTYVDPHLHVVQLANLFPWF
jgi:hypothetical protein